jgi:hypothetical protein
LSFLHGRRRLPNIRIFKRFVYDIILFGLIGTEAAIGTSKITISLPIGILIIDGIIIIGNLLILFTNDGTVIAVHSTEHGLDRLHCVLLLDDIAFKLAPVFDVLLGDVIENYLLLDGIDDLLELLDRLIVPAEVSKVAGLLEIVPDLVEFCLHRAGWVLFYWLLL